MGIHQQGLWEYRTRYKGNRAAAIMEYNSRDNGNTAAGIMGIQRRDNGNEAVISHHNPVSASRSQVLLPYTVQSVVTTVYIHSGS